MGENKRKNRETNSSQSVSVSSSEIIPQKEEEIIPQKEEEIIPQKEEEIIPPNCRKYTFAISATKFMKIHEPLETREAAAKFI